MGITNDMTTDAMSAGPVGVSAVDVGDLRAFEQDFPDSLGAHVGRGEAAAIPASPGLRPGLHACLGKP